MGAFNSPAACFFSCIYSQLFGLIAMGFFYMCGIPKPLNKLPHFIRIRTLASKKNISVIDIIKENVLYIIIYYL